MIKLYKDITLNSSNSYFTVFNDLQKYKISLETYLSNSIEDDKFVLNDGVLMVSAEVFTNEDPYKITYCAHEFNGNTLFYHINSVIFQSGFYAFNVSEDIWANYFYKANIQSLHVTRSSLQIDGYRGIFDPIKATQDRDVEYIGNNRLPYSITLDDLSILYYVTYETGKSSLFRNGATSATKGFFNSIRELCLGGTLIEPVLPDRFVSLDYAVQSVAGIYQAQQGDLEPKFEAGVIKAYIVPSSILLPHTSDFIFQTSCDDVLGPNVTGELRDINAHCLINNVLDTEIELPLLYPNFKYFVGVEHNGMEIERYSGSHKIRFSFIQNNDSLQVILYDGSNSYDITSAFEVGISINDGNISPTEKLTRTLRAVTSVGSGIVQYKLGNYAGAFSSFAETGASTVINGKSSYIGGGDGLLTFRNITKYASQSPFCIVSYKSIENENEHAIKYGVSYDAYLDIFSPFFGLTSGYYYYGYLIQGNILLSGIPEFPAEFIKGVFANGNYFKQVL